MADAVQNKPEPQEIIDQLEHLLVSKRFRRATNQADFLRLIVELTLSRKRVTEEIIGKALFPKFKKKKSSDVRVTARSLRRTLENYYANEGREDRIVISLPRPHPEGHAGYLPGNQYKPRFDYSPLRRANKSFRLGETYLGQRTALGITYASAHFIDAILCDADHISALLLLAETFCLRAWIGDGHSKELFCCVCGIASKVATLAPRNWQAYALYGTASVFLRHRQSARLAFRKALSLDRMKTERYPWYHLYLLALGNTDKALALAGGLADESSYDGYALARHGLLLYAARRFDKAWEQARNALDIDYQCWTAYVVFALVELACGVKSKAFSYLESATRILDGHDVFPGLSALCYESDADPDAKERFVQSAFHHINWRPSPSPTQSALASMAQGNTAAALKSLNQACAQCDPIIVFAESVALFDSLRRDKRFRQLARGRFRARSSDCPDRVQCPGPTTQFLYYAGWGMPSKPTSASNEL